MTRETSPAELLKELMGTNHFLIVQDIDGVCIPLVQDPLKRVISKEYVKDVSKLKDKFSVLTCGEHEGRRGVNRLIEKALDSKYCFISSPCWVFSQDKIMTGSTSTVNAMREELPGTSSYNWFIRHLSRENRLI